MTAASRRFVARLALIGAGAAAWRIWYVLGPVTDRIDRLAGDEFFYSWQARYFVEGRWFTNPFLLHNQHVSDPTALHPPLYTVFLAIPSALGFDTHDRAPHRDRAARHRHRRADRPARPHASPAIASGSLAALLAAFYPPLWSNDAVIGLETLYCFLVVLALIAVYRFWRAPSMWGAVAIAVPLALASLTRSEGIILFVLLGVPTVLLARSWDWEAAAPGPRRDGAGRRAGHRAVGRPEPHDVRRTDRARHRIRTRARLRQLRRDVLRS